MSKPTLRLSAILIALAFACITVGTWAWLNRPETEPEWPRIVWGFALSPYQPGQNAIKEDYPTREEIAHDLDLLKGKTMAIRTYTVAGTIGLVPELAAERGLNVTLGVWLDSRVERNEAELDKAIEIARTHRNVVRIIVGNESVLRGDLPFADAEARHLVLRQVNAAFLPVDGDVLQEVDQLQGGTDTVRPGLVPGVPVLVKVQEQPPDGVGGAPAVIHHFAHVGVAGLHHVLFERREQVVEQSVGQGMGANVGRQGAEDRVVHRLAAFQRIQMQVVFGQLRQALFRRRIALVGRGFFAQVQFPFLGL